MAITLVTGLPGHGKTLYTLATLKEQAEREGRPVFHASGRSADGIPGLNIDGWQVCDPYQWFDLPPNSYVVIDEFQKVFPIRARSSAVPKHVEELETHRHGGLDLFLITQHPMLADTNVRKLVDRHFHVVRTFGLQRATVYEFPTGVQDSPEKNKAKPGVIRHEWAYPKKAYGWYRSATVHTVKARVPLKVWLYVGVALLVPLLLWVVYLRLMSHQAASGASASAASAASSPGRVAPGGLNPRLADAVTATEYFARYRPRVAGLAFTAPVYDELTKPVEAPYPSVCFYGDNMPCRCFSQRGFSLVVEKPLCEQLAREPMDPYWLKRGPHGLERPGEGVGMVSGRDDQVGAVGARAATAPVVDGSQGS